MNDSDIGQMIAISSNFATVYYDNDGNEYSVGYHSKDTSRTTNWRIYKNGQLVKTTTNPGVSGGTPDGMETIWEDYPNRVDIYWYGDDGKLYTQSFDSGKLTEVNGISSVDQVFMVRSHPDVGYIALAYAPDGSGDYYHYIYRAQPAVAGYFEKWKQIIMPQRYNFYPDRMAFDFRSDENGDYLTR